MRFSERVTCWWIRCSQTHVIESFYAAAESYVAGVVLLQHASNMSRNKCLVVNEQDDYEPPCSSRQHETMKENKVKFANYDVVLGQSMSKA